MKYRTVIQEETLGSEVLRIECLEDLNQTIDELFSSVEQGQDPKLLEDLCPYFGVVWPSARALAARLAGLPVSLLQGKTVLEIGCGLGLPSLIATKRGATVLAVDFHPEVEWFIGRNRARNGADGLNYRRVDWQDPSTDLGRFDWIIGSDILYEKQQPAAVAHFVRRHLSDQGQILIADPARPYLQPFSDAMKQNGFTESLQIVQADDRPAPKDIFLAHYRY